MRTLHQAILIALSISVTLLVVNFLGRNMSPEQDESAPLSASRFGPLTSPLTLFPPSAAISLADDNSTSFPARPAAFGPSLRAEGLNGQLWIGSGFSEHLHDGEAEGELGCSDIPGWKGPAPAHFPITGPGPMQDPANRGTLPMAKRSSRIFSRRQGPPVDDGTDNHLHGGLQQTDGLYGDASATRGPDHADIQTIQETAEISGKIALLSRGGCGFLEKVKWAQRRGAIALIVGDNQKGGPLIQMYAAGDTSNVTIPSVFTSWTTAHLLSSLMQPGSFLESTFDKNGNPVFKVQPPGKARNKKHYSRGEPVPVNSPAFASSGGLEMPPSAASGGSDDSGNREGLWITIVPTNTQSPFFDTLLVLIISPLITLGVVYGLLVLRATIRRRRWRAPKSVVSQLPIRTYHTLATSNSRRGPAPRSDSPTAPLLQPASESSPGDHPHNSESTPGGDTPGTAIVESSPEAATSPDNSSPAEPAPPMTHWGRQVECVICLEEYVDGTSRVMTLPCGHDFHAECITPWLTTRRRTCPICKGDVVRSVARQNARARESYNDLEASRWLRMQTQTPRGSRPEPELTVNPDLSWATRMMFPAQPGNPATDVDWDLPVGDIRRVLPRTSRDRPLHENSAWWEFFRLHPESEPREPLWPNNRSRRMVETDSRYRSLY